jgi:hypothetical protein
MRKRIDKKLIDEAFAAYLHWRDTCAEVRQAYGRWRAATARDAGITFHAYRAALEREEHAALLYGRLVSRARP